MQIAGIQKITLVDFPDHVAATVFTRGCSFRCGFCHNPELVIPEKYNSILSEREIFDFLESRFGKLTGVCITGGEPLMQKDIEQFISHVKALGFDVKLDTNGSYPEKLERIIKTGDIDYIAMDIKGTLEKYSLISKFQFPVSNQFSTSKSQSVISIKRGEESHRIGADFTKNIQQSIKLIMNSGIDYEFRTTVCHPYHEIGDFHEIGMMINGAKRYFIQQFVKSKQLDPSMSFEPLLDSEIAESAKIMTQYVKEVGIR